VGIHPTCLISARFTFTLLAFNDVTVFVHFIRVVYNDFEKLLFSFSSSLCRKIGLKVSSGTFSLMYGKGSLTLRLPKFSYNMPRHCNPDFDFDCILTLYHGHNANCKELQNHERAPFRRLNLLSSVAIIRIDEMGQVALLKSAVQMLWNPFTPRNSSPFQKPWNPWNPTWNPWNLAWKPWNIT